MPAGLPLTGFAGLSRPPTRARYNDRMQLCTAHRPAFFACSSIIAAFVLTGLAGHRATAAAPNRAFAPVDCAEFGFDGDLDADEAACGDVTVPLHHDDPGGKTITLAAAVVRRSGGSSPSGAPLILLQGGPGASTIDAYLDLALAPADDPFGLAGLRADRDLVLLDQRGTRYGRPALMCPELVDLTRRTIELDLDADVAYALEDDALADCRERLDDEGVDVAAFNSLENAADIPAVAAALGYDRYHVYGVSYGSLLALHLLRRRPAGLESVVLDGVVPPPIDFNAAAPTSLDGSLTALFDACAAAPDCASAYPGLETTLAAAVERLDASPVRVAITDPATGARYRAIVDGRTLLDAVHQLLYGGPSVPVIPAIIDAVARGRYGALAEFMGLWTFDDSMAEGMYLSTVCSEDGDIDPEAVPLDDVRPWVADQLAGDADDVLAACEIWDVPLFGDTVDAPVTSDTPALLLSGRFDPITPPPFAAAAARTLSRAQLVVFPSGAHGALGDPCPNAIVAAFLVDPTAAVNTTCTADSPMPDFVTPTDAYFTAVPRRLLARLLPLTVEDGADGTQGDDELLTLDGRARPTGPDPLAALAPALMLLIAWLALITVAGGWAVGRAFGARSDGRWPARLIPWLSAGAVLALPTFAVGAVVVLGDLLDSGRDAVLYVGVPRGAAWLLWLPPFAAACGALLFGVTVWAWRVRAWSVARRLHASVIGAAGLAIAVSVVWLAV